MLSDGQDYGISVTLFSQVAMLSNAGGHTVMKLGTCSSIPSIISDRCPLQYGRVSAAVNQVWGSLATWRSLPVRGKILRSTYRARELLIGTSPRRTRSLSGILDNVSWRSRKVNAVDGRRTLNGTLKVTVNFEHGIDEVPADALPRADGMVGYRWVRPLAPGSSSYSQPIHCS